MSIDLEVKLNDQVAGVSEEKLPLSERTVGQVESFGEQARANRVENETKLNNLRSYTKKFQSKFGDRKQNILEKTES